MPLRAATGYAARLSALLAVGFWQGSGKDLVSGDQLWGEIDINVDPAQPWPRHYRFGIDLFIAGVETAAASLT
jgi:hypothetical protein